eukprot:scaffold7076_cov149-Amphora_coffeaeformis.AAC.2
MAGKKGAKTDNKPDPKETGADKAKKGGKEEKGKKNEKPANHIANLPSMDIASSTSRNRRTAPRKLEVTREISYQQLSELRSKVAELKRKNETLEIERVFEGLEPDLNAKNEPLKSGMNNICLRSRMPWNERNHQILLAENSKLNDTNH